MRKIDTASLLVDFESEARTHIERIESAFLDTDAFAKDPSVMDEVFRAAHSLKGTAGFFSLRKIVAVAHELESVFTKIKNGNLLIDDGVSETVLKSVDCLKELADNLQAQDSVEISGVIDLLKNYSSGEIASKPVNESIIPLDTDKMQNSLRRGQWGYFIKIDANTPLGKYSGRPRDLIDEILSVGVIVKASMDGAEIASADIPDKAFSELEMLVTSVLEPELFFIAVELSPDFVRLIPKKMKNEIDSVQMSPAPTPTVNTQAANIPKADFFIRLDVSAVNSLMDLANEMILTRNRLLSTTSAYHKNIPGLAPVLLELNRLSSEIQEKVMLQRMQPISEIFKKFPRIIHDMARQLNKNITIEVLGGDVALDKYLLDALSDPITQLVRNSADHGVESPKRRAELGKPKNGLITLNAYMRGGFAIIEVSDDGAGIDTDALKKKCLERNMATEEQLALMPESLLYNFIFEPGFSTAKGITSVSGRGVGMDIVKTNIERMSGSIEIKSKHGEGTTTRLRMPLTLSLVSTLIVEINSVRYAVPEGNIESILRIAKNAPDKHFERINDSLVLNLNGWIVPVVTMEEIDAASKTESSENSADYRDRILSKNIVKCLLLKTNGMYFALIIDDALKTEETLVNPLPVYLKHCRCYSNVAVLGSGETVMILNAEGIIRMTGIDGAKKEEAAITDQAENLRQIISFKGSGSEHFALDANHVIRIERITKEQIQEIGGKFYANISEKTVRILMPEDYAPVSKREYNEKFMYLLMLKTEISPDVPVALISRKPPIKTEGNFSFNHSLFENEFIIGTSAYGEKILIFINIEEILQAGVK